MSEHYYTQTPKIAHARQTYEVTVKHTTLSFITDAGVFSRNGLDFGSRLLIEHLKVPIEARVLDVGCGYGVIGLFTAAMNGTANITMLDVNERAVSLAKENAQRNNLQHVRVIQSDVFEQLDAKPFTTIVTNPPIRAGKQIVHQIYEQAIDRLEDGGTLWVVIQKKQGAASTKRKLQSLYAEVDEVAKAKGYRVYKATKR